MFSLTSPGLHISAKADCNCILSDLVLLPSLATFDVLGGTTGHYKTVACNVIFVILYYSWIEIPWVRSGSTLFSYILHLRFVFPSDWVLSREIASSCANWYQADIMHAFRACSIFQNGTQYISVLPSSFTPQMFHLITSYQGGHGTLALYMISFWRRKCSLNYLSGLVSSRSPLIV